MEEQQGFFNESNVVKGYKWIAYTLLAMGINRLVDINPWASQIIYYLTLAALCALVITSMVLVISKKKSPLYRLLTTGALALALAIGIFALYPATQTDGAERLVPAAHTDEFERLLREGRYPQAEKLADEKWAESRGKNGEEHGAT